LAYIGSGSIDFQGTRIEIRKPFFISGSIGANNKGFLDSSAQIRLSGGDGGPATNTTTTQIGVDHPWESYMELDLHRVLDAGGSGFNLVSIGPGDFPGQIVNLAITTASTGSGAGANKLSVVFSGSGGNAAAGYGGLFADGMAPLVQGLGNSGQPGHVGAAWQMIWTGTYWIVTQSNSHVQLTKLT